MTESCDLKARLAAVGIGATRQRLALADLLFGGPDRPVPDRHVTAEQLFAEALAAGHDLSLATVYNTLKAFGDAGLLREVVVDAERTYYDTNASRHHHFYAEETRSLSDIPDQHLVLTRLPAPPDGMAVTGYEVTIRLCKRRP